MKSKEVHVQEVTLIEEVWERDYIGIILFIAFILSILIFGIVFMELESDIYQMAHKTIEISIEELEEERHWMVCFFWGSLILLMGVLRQWSNWDKGFGHYKKVEKTMRVKG